MSDPTYPRDYELEERCKAHFKRRLRQRWLCLAPGHTHCFRNAEGIHVPIDEDGIDTWANAWFRGDTTLFCPPPLLYSARAPSMSDAQSTTSFVTARSRSTVEYQRPVGLRQAFRSLTDLRSARVNFSASSVSLSASHTSSSSIVPNIGYLSGKAIYWLGEQILTTAEAVEINRRLWLIKRLVRRKQAASGGFPLGAKESNTLHNAALDLLELASSRRSIKIQANAVALANNMESLFYAQALSEWSKLGCFDRIRIDLATQFWGDDGARVQAELRDLCLQDDASDVDVDTALEIATLLCFELTHGPPSPWMWHGYRVLRLLFAFPSGREAMQRVEETPGAPLSALARRFFEQDTDDGTRCTGVAFFVQLAEIWPHFGRYLEGRHGIPVLCSMLEAEQNKLSPDFLRLFDIVQVLVFYALHSSHGDLHLAQLLDASTMMAVLRTRLMHILENATSSARLKRIPAWGLSSLIKLIYLMSRGSKSFSRAVSEQMTDELQHLLAQGMYQWERSLGVNAARPTYDEMRLVWPSYIAEIDNELNRLGSKLPGG